MKQRFFLCYAILLLALLFNACEEPPQKAPLEPGPVYDPSAGNTNGPLTGTGWSAFAYHGYSGADSGSMHSSNTIFIDKNTTALQGAFWGSYAGVHPSSYSASNPAFVMPTSPRIFVQAGTTLIEIIQGSHADYGTIVWTPAYTENGRVDVYFKPDNSVVSPGDIGIK